MKKWRVKAKWRIGVSLASFAMILFYAVYQLFTKGWLQLIDQFLGCFSGIKLMLSTVPRQQGFCCFPFQLGIWYP
jgi:hypothetical protein